MKRKRISQKHAVFAALMLMLPLSSWAAEGDSTNVEVKGTIFIQPACHLNNKQDLAYEFNQVVVSDVDAGKVSLTHPLKIECEYSPTAQVKLTFKSADVAPAMSNAVKVGNTGLGIALFSTGFGPDVAIPLNMANDITDGTTLQLKAKLVNLNPAAALTTGKFSATVTIESSYE